MLTCWTLPRSVIGVVSLACASVLIGAAGAQVQWELRNDTVLVEVNGRAITLADLRQAMRPILSNPKIVCLYPGWSPEALDELANDTLNQLVDRELILDVYHQNREFETSAAEIDREFGRRLTEEFGGDEDHMRFCLVGPDGGTSDLLTQIAEDLIVSRMHERRRLIARPVSETAVQRYYAENRTQFERKEAVRLSVIRLDANPEDPPETIRQAYSIITAVADGAQFAEMARRHSTDSRRARGGDWGWLARGDLKDLFARIAFDMAVGQTSEPVPYDRFVLILHVAARRPAGIPALSEVRDEIFQMLTRKEELAVVKAWKDELRQQACIVWATPPTSALTLPSVRPETGHE